MATSTTVHGQLIRYDASGNQTIINLKSTGTDVSIDRSQNTKLPSSVSTVQTLANALKALAFKDSLSKSDVGLGSVDNTADANKSVKYATSAGSATSASNVKDSGTGNATTFAYSKAGLNYDQYTWLAAWNGLELRAINKNQFARASHSHDYVPSNQFQSYVLHSGNGTVKWQKLGVVTSLGDSSDIIFDIYTGDGFNASSYQNVWIRIMIKDGWQSTESATSACGATAWIFYPRESATSIDNLKIMIRATSSVDYGVYAYFPWTYCNGNFTIMGRFTKFVYDGTILDSAPTVGTEQEVRLVKMITGDTVVDDDELLYVSKTAPNKACIWAKLD